MNYHHKNLTEPFTRRHTQNLASEAEIKPLAQVLPDLNATAIRLGELVADLPIFNDRGQVVFRNYEGALVPMNHRKFRTWISDHLRIYREHDTRTGAILDSSLDSDEAETILESDSFLRRLRPLTEHLPDGVDGERDLANDKMDIPTLWRPSVGRLSSPLPVNVDEEGGGL
jgi:hypothetical protein